jgi:hypothetical protein
VILGRRRDGGGQNKLIQINGSKDNSTCIVSLMNLMQSYIQNMGFMIGKSSAEPSLKLHLLRLEIQPWPVAPRRIISDLALQLQSEDNV